MSVDILAIGENNRKKLQEQQQNSIINPWRQQQAGQVEQISPKTQRQQALDKQVEVGLGARIDDVMTKKDKQLYADGLSEGDRQLMQRYKAEGYSFEASKAMVDQKKELADPYAQGVNKFKDYQAKEQYYNQGGGLASENMGTWRTLLYATHPELGIPMAAQPIMEKLREWSVQYGDRAGKESQAFEELKENGQGSLGNWLSDTLIKAGYGFMQGIGKMADAGIGANDIIQSGIQSKLDNAILGYGTDSDFYRETDRRLDEYALEYGAGAASTMFWMAWLPVMLGMTAFGNTKAGESTIGWADDKLGQALDRTLDNFPAVRKYYQSLDEQAQEDMRDIIKDAIYYKGGKKVGERTGKLKETTPVKRVSNFDKILKESLSKGAEEGKTQIGKEIENVKTATDLYNEQGVKIGKAGEVGEVGIGKSTGRVVDAAVKGFRENFTKRINEANEYNTRRKGGVMAEPTEQTGTEQPTAKPTETPKKGGIKDLATQTWDTVITGLTPEERVRIQNDPYTNQMWLKAKQMIDEAGMPLEDSFITEQLYSEIGDNIQKTFEERDQKLSNIKAYQELRKNTNRYILSPALTEVERVLNENDITMDPISKELDFSNSKFVSDADMRSVQRAVNRMYKDLSKPITAREYLNMRDILKQLASYATVDASRGQSLIRQLRHTANDIAHKTIPGLKDADKITSKYYNEIEELKDGWVYKGGDRKGQIRNNFYSIIKNLTGQNRKVMLDRLEKYYPGVGEQIEAIHIVNKIVKAYNKSPQMVKSLGLGGALGGATIGGGLVGALVGAIAGEMVNKGLIEPRTKSKRRKAIDKLLNQLSPEAMRKLEAIAVRQLTAKEISQADQEVLDRVVETIKKERDGELGETALKEWSGGGMFSKGGNAPQFKEIKFASRNLYELATEDPIEKFDGKLTAEQKKEGKELYKIADKKLDGDVDSDREIIAARGKFLVMNQKPGYTKALGLDQGKVNESIRRRWEENGGADEKLKQFNRWINDSIEPKYWFTGITNLITYTNPRRNVDAINFLVKDVKGAEDIDTATYKPWIDATIDSLLLMDAHFNHGETNIRFTTQAEMNKYALELAKNKANGEFVPDILTLVAGQGRETIPHEIGHEGDAIIGAELFGMKFIRNSGHSEWFATGKLAMEYLRNNGSKWHSGLDYKTPEALEFHREMIDILNDIEIPEWMKNDKSPNSDGTPMSEYRTRPEEVWARFRQANITLTREMNQLGKVPKKTYKSDHGDTYPIELYKRWAQLLQKHQKLVDAGAFYDVEPINRSGISTRNGLKDVAPQKRMTKAEKKKEAMKKLSEIFDNTTILDKKNELVLKNYDPDMQKWVDNTQFPEGLLVDRYETLRNAFKDKKIREGLDIAAEAKDFSEIAKIVKEFIEKPELKWEEPNGEYIRPIRQWFNNHPGITLDSMEYSYSEDPLTWKEKLTSNRRDKVSIQDLKELGSLLKELTQKGTPEFTDDSSGLETFTESRVGGGKLNHLVESVLGGGHETFAENRLKTVGQDTWVNVIDPMLGIVGDAIEGFYESGDNAMKSTDKREEFNNIVLERLGETYRSNVKEWAEEINRNLGYIADDFEYKLRRKNVIPESKLQNLQAKVREIEPILEKGRRSLDSLGTSSEAKMDMRYFLDGFQKREKEVATEATEKVKQLVALSNMDVKNFEKQMKDFGGKSPMPSIAVTDINVPHTAFGDLTLVFGRETVDPQADPRNKIYASDAWTTTFPTLEKAGGITWELVNRETPKMVERAKENGIDLTDEETKELRQRIGSELLDSSWSEGFYTGWEDMGEMIVDKAIEKAGLDWDQWRENSDAYLRLTFDVASLIRDNQRRDVIPAWYFKPEAHVTTEDMERVSFDIAKALPEKGIEKLQEYGYDHFYDPKEPETYTNSYEQGVYSEFVDTIDRLDQFGYTGAEADEHGGKSMLSKFKDAYGFETKDIVPLLEKVWGEIIPERLTHTGFADKLLESTPINDGNIKWDEGLRDHIEMYDKNRQDMNGEIFEISSELARTLLTQRGDGQLTDEITNKLIDRWAEDVSNTIENRVRVDLREKDGVDSESDEEIRKRDKDDKNMNRINTIMGGVKASLEDMKLYVRDVINNELLVETVDRSRPVTPENILEAMKNQGGPRRTNDKGTLRDLVGVEGKEFTDIEQVRGKNLAKTTHDDRTGDLSDIEHRYNVIVDEIQKIIKDNGNFEASREAIRENIANSYDADIDKFREKLRDERAAYYEVPDDYLQAIIDAVELGKQVPVRFSEAKPERVVDLYKEVEYILVPKNDFQKVNDIVRGTPLEGKVHMYDRDGFKDARSQRMKNLQARYGNIFFGMGGLVMPIAMLLMMIQQEETA